VPATLDDEVDPHRCRRVRRQGYALSHVTVGEFLHQLGYSLQANAKENEGRQHEDRDAQFVHLNGEVEAHLAAGQPVISVDAKKGASGF